MRVLLQRVRSAEVTVEKTVVGTIGLGLVAFVGFGEGDSAVLLDPMAEKIASLRVFSDENGKMNRSLLQASRAILAVSQFTLYADTTQGRRPGFSSALPAKEAAVLFDGFCEALSVQGLDLARGRFGADMDVALVNWGPVTIWLEAPSSQTHAVRGK